MPYDYRQHFHQYHKYHTGLVVFLKYNTSDVVLIVDTNLMSVMSLSIPDLLYS